MLDIQFALEAKYAKQEDAYLIQKYLQDNAVVLSTKLLPVVIELLRGCGKNLPIQSIINILMSNGVETVTDATVFLLQNQGEWYTLINHGAGNIVLKPTVRLPNELIRKLTVKTVLPPLLVQPLDWDSQAKNGGYYTVKHPLVLGSKNKHDKPLAVDVVNKLQSIAWTIDMDILMNYHDDTSYSTDKVLDVTSDIIGNSFFFMWQYDSRGRMYSKGYELNLQSSEYHKALLSFDNAEVCTQEGIEEILLWVANTAGYDKLSWSDRLAMGKHLVDTRVSFSEDDSVAIDLTDIAEPILFTKAAIAYYDALTGESIGLPVMWDATASGLQVLACLTGCKATAEKVNLIDTGKREDVYIDLCNIMNAELNMEDWVSRDDVKKPLMTHFYSSVGNPKKAFNDAQLKAFYTALSVGFTGAENFMYLVNHVVWKDLSEFTWTLPDGHTAVVRTFVNESTKVEIAEGVTFVYEEAVNKANGNYLHMAANITHSVDAYVAREMVRRCDFEVAHIHDSFICHPNNAKKLRNTYKEVLADLADMDLLSSICQELGTQVQLEKLSTDLGDDIRNSVYALS